MKSILAVAWLASTNLAMLSILEAPAGFSGLLSNLVSDTLNGSELVEVFWTVEKLVDCVVDVFDRSVWDVRDEVRDIEMLEMRDGRKPRPTAIRPT